MSEHTPVGKYPPVGGVTSPRTFRLAALDDKAEKKGEAHARLIASAPTLLDLVRRLVHPMATEEDVDDALALLAELDA